VSWQDLKDRFRDIGTIIRADILTGPDGRSKGQGTILFESPAEAEAAIQKHNGSDFNGRNIDVRLYKFKSYN
jgi:RNA recognition motif-containing protein